MARHLTWYVLLPTPAGWDGVSRQRAAGQGAKALGEGPYWPGSIRAKCAARPAAGRQGPAGVQAAATNGKRPSDRARSSRARLPPCTASAGARPPLKILDSPPSGASGVQGLLDPGEMPRPLRTRPVTGKKSGGAAVLRAAAALHMEGSTRLPGSAWPHTLGSRAGAVWWCARCCCRAATCPGELQALRLSWLPVVCSPPHPTPLVFPFRSLCWMTSRAQ